MPRHRYECTKGHISEFTTRSVNDDIPVMIPCEFCTQGREAAWIPSGAHKMLLTREKMRKHSQPDEWDPQTNPKLRPKRVLQPGGPDDE